MIRTQTCGFGDRRAIQLTLRPRNMIGCSAHGNSQIFTFNTRHRLCNQSYILNRPLSQDLSYISAMATDIMLAVGLEPTRSSEQRIFLLLYVAIAI